MLHYPKIPGSRQYPDGRCVAFEKCDGTNLHWDWDRECGWHSFGTRRDEFVFSPVGIEQFCQAHAHLRESVEVFQVRLASGIENVFHDHAGYRAFDTFKVFTEFLGPNSFSGLHKADDPKQMVLFDVLADPFGFVGPEQFVRDFGHLAISRVVYRGKLTGKFCDDVRQGKYGVNEGVVCKGGTGGADLWMVKIKTYAYMGKLKAAFAENWEDHWE
jgi:hypothetical protein